MDLVLAVRQPLSAPTWAKPSVSVSVAAAPEAGAAPLPPELPQAARPTVRSAVAAAATTRAVRDVFVDTFVLRRWGKAVSRIRRLLT